MIFNDKQIIANKGVQKGSVLSPLLFNAYLDHRFQKNPKLKKACGQGKIIALSDDFLLICDDKAGATDLMQSMETIENFSFQINQLKSKIRLDRIEKTNLTAISGIKVVDKFKTWGLYQSGQKDSNS